MNQHQKKRTRGQLLMEFQEELFEMVHPGQGKLKRAQLEQTLVPHLKNRSGWDAELSEEEYQRLLNGMRAEKLPALIHQIQMALKHRGPIPPHIKPLN